MEDKRHVELLELDDVEFHGLADVVFLEYADAQDVP